MDIQDKVKRLGALRIELDAVKQRKEELMGEYDFLSDEICKHMQDNEVRQIAVDGVGMCYLTCTTQPYIKDQDKVIEWARESGLGDIATLKISYGRLKEALEECVEKDRPLPPEEIVSLNERIDVRFRRQK